jgi:Amt family ammonium transporter
MILDMFRFRKTAVIGAVQGMITGLVAITPAAGVVDAWGAVIIGILASVIAWVSLNVFGKFKIFNRVDDTLRVFDTHAVAGLTGGISVGFLATTRGCAAFGLPNPGGAIEGNWRQVCTTNLYSVY